MENFDQLMAQIKNDLIREQKKRKSRCVAAFDADGTLWDIDCGENFLRFLVRNKIIDDVSGVNPWDYYNSLRWEAAKVEEALVWLTTTMSGKSWSEVRALAEASYLEALPFPHFAEMGKLVAELMALGLEVFVVSASPKWSVEPAAKRIGIDAEHVLGLQCKTIEGRLSEEIMRPMSHGPGKVEVLRSIIGDKELVFAAGNTMGDFPLIKASKGKGLAISSVPAGGLNFSSEFELQTAATVNSWYKWSF
ncbi:MAG: haloacid dehalogenase-like hydrolase [Oligoflexales bacterium]|nr:haloacid dehalogenase-like hydrolase [Oligoflexales bacterium]